jgi:hypothetical protein
MISRSLLRKAIPGWPLRRSDGAGAARGSNRRVGLFTIASKNYLAHVRVLLKSVAAVHPEYKCHLFLVDRVDGTFDARAEGFSVIECEKLGIPCFEDMAVRYDIMELNTAVKPFVFRWLIDSTDLDSLIYLDPDTRVYSRFQMLESILSTDTSVVLTPHITKPLGDNKTPNDYHILQAGAFNLGFAAINRCDEACAFIDWWGRQLVTRAAADFSHHLFTDQRWCDLAPCFLDRLHILKCPAHNVAYWNLSQRRLARTRERWQVDEIPLVFFHFSGMSVRHEHVLSKHQDRFEWSDLPSCRELFASYRHELLEEGWETSSAWKYAYATTSRGVPIPRVVRQIYRLQFPLAYRFKDADVTQTLIDICNSPVKPLEQGGPELTQLMYFIYAQRPDIQAMFNIWTAAGRAGFCDWYLSTAVQQYSLPTEFMPTRADTTDQVSTAEPRQELMSTITPTKAAASPPSAELQTAGSYGLAETWNPSSIETKL